MLDALLNCSVMLDAYSTAGGSILSLSDVGCLLNCSVMLDAYSTAGGSILSLSDVGSLLTQLLAKYFESQ